MGGAPLLALATHTGSLELCTLADSVWQLQADHQFVARGKIALATGAEALAACACGAWPRRARRPHG